MIIIDTNVLSGLMRPAPDPALLRWADRQPLDSLWITSITVMETRFGLELLPLGRRRDDMMGKFARLLDVTLQGRVVSFEREAAEAAARFAASRRLAGRPVDFRDTEIAGIVAAHGATLATRDTNDFDGWTIELINPWQPTI